MIEPTLRDPRPPHQQFSPEPFTRSGHELAGTIRCFSQSNHSISKPVGKGALEPPKTPKEPNKNPCFCACRGIWWGFSAMAPAARAYWSSRRRFLPAANRTYPPTCTRLTVSGQALLAYGKPHLPSNLRCAGLRRITFHGRSVFSVSSVFSVVTRFFFKPPATHRAGFSCYALARYM